jgi:hypothetical protein
VEVGLRAGEPFYVCCLNPLKRNEDREVLGKSHCAKGSWKDERSSHSHVDYLNLKTAIWHFEQTQTDKLNTAKEHASRELETLVSELIDAGLNRGAACVLLTEMVYG